jgi:hypothetical protein
LVFIKAILPDRTSAGVAITQRLRDRAISDIARVALPALSLVEDGRRWDRQLLGQAQGVLMQEQFAVEFMELREQQEREQRRLRWLIEEVRKARAENRPASAYQAAISEVTLECEAIEFRIREFLKNAEQATESECARQAQNNVGSDSPQRSPRC